MKENMARVEWCGYYQCRKMSFSYKRMTIIICCVNIVIGLYILHSLCSSLQIFSFHASSPGNVYTPDQNRKMEESIRIQRAAEPLELVKLVKEVKHKLGREKTISLSRPLKRKITDEILRTLKELPSGATRNEQRDAVENWRKEKVEEVRQLTLGKNLTNSVFLPEESDILIGALESNWDVLAEEIGVWIPVEVTNKVHDDKPEGEEDFDENIIPGRPPAPQCHAEIHTDYGGFAVRWGLTHRKESAADCCQACLDHAKRAKPGEKQCNIWVYCPYETGCFSPDIYDHKHQECWLKYAEKPKLNFKDKYSDSYRNSHPTAPLIVPWISGIVSSA